MHNYGLSNSIFDQVFEAAGDKEKILLILLKNNITLKEIVSLTLDNITLNGIKVGEKEILIDFEILAGYLSVKGNFIKKKARFLFPSSKRKTHMEADNIKTIIDTEARKHGFRWNNLGLSKLIEE